ncbi:MAG: xanthine dehydrogenase family protein molybdopterin-binding subunit, partial [Alphaproteobacteria bacterium]|nr:xanthine dehydrogenase family protein molybdopterin-binding subunit [Alphaproteobacteria bacterium]
MAVRYLGRSISRLEDARFLTGHGAYVADMPAGDCLHAQVLRSPYAHARIVRIDVTAARALPGVVAILTEADLAADGIGELPCVTVFDAVEPLVVPPRPALARGRVRHVGDPVAFVVAETPEAALDALEAIVVDYEPLPGVTDGQAALAPDAPQIWPQATGNSAFLFRKGDPAAVAHTFARADRVVACDLVNNRVVIAPLEPRAAVGTYDPPNDLLHLTVTGQAVHGMRRQLADAVFRLPADRMRLTVP